MKWQVLKALELAGSKALFVIARNEATTLGIDKDWRISLQNFLRRFLLRRNDKTELKIYLNNEKRTTYFLYLFNVLHQNSMSKKH